MKQLTFIATQKRKYIFSVIGIQKVNIASLRRGFFIGGIMAKEIGKIHIVSDGLGRNTHVYNGEGNEIKGIRHLDLTIPLNEPAYAKLECILPRVNIKAEGTKTEMCPYCGREKEED